MTRTNPFADLARYLRQSAHVCILLSLGACEKYAEDIPEWLEQRIKYCAREDNNCRGLSVEEFTYQGERYYELSEKGESFGLEELYDEQGVVLCSGQLLGIGVHGDSCGGIWKRDFVLVRHIWNED